MAKRPGMAPPKGPMAKPPMPAMGNAKTFGVKAAATKKK